MLIPQSLAYALLAGLPAETGIYASIAPIVLYAIFGTSRALAVGPVAVVSLMTAAAIGNLAEPGSPELLVAAITLAFISGLFLILLGVFRLGFLANFLSHPVIAGFITASGILIALSQLRHVLGISRRWRQSARTNRLADRKSRPYQSGTLVIGVSATVFCSGCARGSCRSCWRPG
jgi:SulP family sulfate permease